jgi:hypothetical protein
MGSLSKGTAGGLRLMKGGVRSAAGVSPVAGAPPAIRTPASGVNLLLPESAAERIKDAVLRKKLRWDSPISLGDGKDAGVVQVIGGLSGDAVLMYFDADEEAIHYPPWYVSALCVRACRKSRAAKRNRPPAIVLLVSDDSLAGRWTLESQNCRGAGLLSDFQIGVLGDWDEDTASERVDEWTRELQDARTQSVIISKVEPSPTRLAGSLDRPNQYFVFMASPGDLGPERALVEQFFKDYKNRNLQRGERVELLAWENLASSGTGDPQQLVFDQVLEPYKKSLVLMICLVKHRLGGDARRRSGTLQEFEWALDERASNLPSLEIKWFLSNESFNLDSSLTSEQRNAKYKQYEEAEQFKKKIREGPYLYVDFTNDFLAKLEHDLGLWFANPKRPWNAGRAEPPGSTETPPPPKSVWE